MSYIIFNRYQRFPEEWKAELQKAKNPEHRNQLLQFYMQRVSFGFATLLSIQMLKGLF